jgi:hypothetical protein
MRIKFDIKIKCQLMKLKKINKKFKIKYITIIIKIKRI